jgi:hypothetical protein
MTYANSSIAPYWIIFSSSTMVVAFVCDHLELRKAVTNKENNL